MSKVDLGSMHITGIRPIALNPTIPPPPLNTILDLSNGEKGIITQDWWLDDNGAMWVRMAILTPMEITGD